MVALKEILHRDILNPESVTSASDDFFILDNPSFLSAERFPFKNDWLIATLCESGSASGIVNLREYHVEPGGFIIILPGQVVVQSILSEDFKGKILLMSPRFTDSLDIGRTFTLTARIASRPYYQFQDEAIEIPLTYLASCRAIIRQNSGSPVVWEVLRLLTRAFFLGAAPMLETRTGTIRPGIYSKLTEDFLALVEREYRNHRELSYYARELGRNVKYLSRHVKEETGRNASEWIGRCIVIDAEAQLLSTQKTILEISDSLGFPTQSFFGKFFKRLKGTSPKEFRLSQTLDK